MLSYEEIEILIKKGTFTEEKRTETKPWENKIEREISFIWEDYKLETDSFRKPVFYLADHEFELQIKLVIDKGIEDHFVNSTFEIKDEVKNKIDLCLPYKEERIKELEKCYSKYLNSITSELNGDWEYSYLSEDDTMFHLKWNFYSHLDKQLSYNDGTIIFHFRYEFLEGETLNEKTFQSFTRRILYLKTLKWIKEQILIEKGMANEPLPETIQTNSKDKLSHKQQILLLDKLGVLEIPEIMKLNATEKGKLFSYLLNRDEKNTYDYIRNKDATKNSLSMVKDFVKTDKNLERVNEILKEIGLEK